MCERNHSGLFFTCALVEQLGRDLKLKRCDVIKALGLQGVQMIPGHADVFHCEPIEKVSGQGDVAEALVAVYTSWIDEKLCDYNSSFYYQSRDYIAECYRAGHVIDA